MEGSTEIRGSSTHYPYRLLCIIIGVIGLTACVSFTQKQAEIYRQLQQGNPHLALQYLEESSHGQRDRVLYELDKAMLLRLTGDYAASNDFFENAKKNIQLLSATSITENLAAVMVNEIGRSYAGQPYEQLLLYAYKVLNYLALGDIDGARVEVLQADTKLRTWNAGTERQGIEASVFMRYLSGIVFELTGERDDALIAYRNAYDVLQNESQPVPLALQQDLLRLTADLDLRDEYKRYREMFADVVEDYKVDRNSGEVILIFNQGLVSRQYAQVISNFSPDLHHYVQIAVPAYPLAMPPITTAELRIEGQVGRTELLQDVDRLARDNLDARMPGIIARAMVRMVAKKAISKNAGDENQLAGFLVDLTGLLTEQADTRSWTSLPESIQVARLVLPAGRHRLQVTVPADRATLYERTITLKPGQKVVISVHDTADYCCNGEE